MEVNFGKVEVTEFDGSKGFRDVSDDLGKTIYYYSNGSELDLQFGKKIAAEKVVNLTKTEAKVLQQYVDKYFTAYLKVALIPLLQQVIDKPDDESSAEEIK